MTLDQQSICELGSRISEFIHRHKRQPENWMEVAKFFDDLRQQGQFADNPTVNGLYRIALAPNADELLARVMAENDL